MPSTEIEDFAVLSDGVNKFAFAIAGYQFPENVTCPWDSNWLLLAVHAQDGMHKIERQAPCITVHEANDFGQWLYEIGNNKKPPERLEFLEPNIRLAWNPGFDDSVVQISISIRDTLHPDWPEPEQHNRRERIQVLRASPWLIRLNCSRSMIKFAASTFSVQRHKYPLRGETF